MYDVLYRIARLELDSHGHGRFELLPRYSENANSHGPAFPALERRRGLRVGDNKGESFNRSHLKVTYFGFPKSLLSRFGFLWVALENARKVCNFFAKSPS